MSQPTDDPTNPNEKNGTPLSDDDEIARLNLSVRRAICTEMFGHIENFPWLLRTPDVWILRIMEELRPAARHFHDRETFRAALIKCGAALIASIQMCDIIEQENKIATLQKPTEEE